MPRANVSSSVTDESAVIPAQEGSSSLVAGIIDPDPYPDNLLGSLGFTQEREQGYMTISSLGEWHERLKTSQPTGWPNNGDGSGTEPFLHTDADLGRLVSGNQYAGLSFERWPSGSQFNRWNYQWNFIENYLQYGGSVVVFSSKGSESLGDITSRAKQKSIALDLMVSTYFAQNNDIRNIVENREDCIALTSVPSENKAGILRSFGEGGPNYLASVGGATASLYDNYSAVTPGLAKNVLDITVVGNTGNTYSYDPGRLVYSVEYRSEIPLQYQFGTTTDVVSWERYFGSHEKEFVSGIRGWTADFTTAAAQAVGATNGLTLERAPVSGAFRYGKGGDPNTDQETLEGMDPDLNAQTSQAFIDQMQSAGGITYYENPYGICQLGRILIRNKLWNLRDGTARAIIETRPTLFPASGTILGENHYARLVYNGVPANWMDTFSYLLGDPGVSNNFDVGTNAFAFALPGSRSFDLIPDPLNSGKKIPTSTPFYGFSGTQVTNSYSHSYAHLLDLNRTFDPTFDLLDNLYGPDGVAPSSYMLDKSNESINAISNLGLGFTHGTDTNLFKKTFNIFGSSGASLDVTDSAGNKPLDFWGCTCSKIPEFLTTFNIVGITPDVCIEVGPNSTSQEVTADGSTYTAYIGWSEPTVTTYIPNSINIFGENIGSASGSNPGFTFNSKFSSSNIAQASDSNFTHPLDGTNFTAPARTFLFYPLITNPDFNDEAPAGPGNRPLSKDTNNYFYAKQLLVGNDAGQGDGSSIATQRYTDAFLDENMINDFLPSFSSNPNAQFASTRIPNFWKQYGRLTADLPIEVNSKSFAGFTLANQVGFIGTPSETFKKQFYGLGPYTGGGTFNGGVQLIAEVEVVSGLPSEGFAPSDFSFDATNYTYNNIFSSNAGLYEFPVFGEKYSTDSFENYSSEEDSKDIKKSNEIPFTSDVAGVFARQFRDLQPWFSPANQSVSSITDIIAERYHLSNAEQDDLYDSKVNFIKNLDGSLRLFGDKTFADSTSTFSRVNVANLFIYLKKKLEPLGRRLLFEPNDEESRQLFINTAEPFLETLRGQRAISDFRVVCDETNNTPDVIDSNQCVVDIFIKPVKTINFIKLRITNVGTSFELE